MTAHKTQRFAIARNARDRPTCQHVMADPGMTMCGSPVKGWAVFYSSRRIGALLCKRCARITGMTW